MFAINLAGMSIGEIAIAIVIIAGIVALVFIGTRAMGISIPQWFIQAFWVVIICFVIIIAIRLVMSM